MQAAGNTKLVDYGIMHEESDIRAHVSVITGIVYVYPTAEAVELVGSGNYRMASAYTNGIETARGYLVPPGDIPHCREVPIPPKVLTAARFLEGDTTSQKGDKAVSIVKWLLRAGQFPLWVESEIIKDHEMQVNGTDIIVRINTRIQVKCDYRAGKKESGGTGNLFIQIAECNPYLQY